MAENGSIARLRERVEVLDQARDQAAAELKAKEQRGSVTSLDLEHYRTVTAFLDQQIAESCALLFSKGGAKATADLNCPGKTTALKKVEKNTPATTSSDQTVGKNHEKVVVPKQELPSAGEPPPEVIPARKEKEERVVPQQEQPSTGILAAIRRWWESLFKPKPPPTATGSETKHPSKQAENTATEDKNTQSSGEASTQQAVQNSVSENPDSAGDSDNNGQSDNSDGSLKTALGEKGTGQKQEQQHKNGAEQVVENDVKGSEAAGQEKSTFGNTSDSVGSNTTEQNGAQSGASIGAIGKTDSAGRGAGRQEGGSGKQENKKGEISSLTKERRPVEIGSRGSAQKMTGQKDGAAQEDPAQPAGHITNDMRQKQSGPVGSGPEVKRSGGENKEGTGSPPVADAEVAKLERTLRDAMDEFDGKLLSEQERLSARMPKQREGSAVGSGGYGAEAPLGPAGGGYEGSEAQEDSRQPGSVAAGGGKPAPSASGRSTIDTDDDIVARQLREAAEKETDPVLKEKLWQEYRKYKQGGG